MLIETKCRVKRENTAQSMEQRMIFKQLTWMYFPKYVKYTATLKLKEKYLNEK